MVDCSVTTTKPESANNLMGMDRLNKSDQSGQARMVEISEAELPLHCPVADQMLWNSHPRVFLPVEESGEALCPYCGTRYVLKGGAVKSGH